MKVFWLSNQAKERGIPMFRGHKELMNINKLNVKEQSPFNYLIINNPAENSCICTLYDLKLNGNGISKIGLYMSDNLSNTNKAKQAGVLYVDCVVNKDSLPRHIELSTINNTQNNDIDLFHDHYSILLPGGGLILEFDKGIFEVNLDVHWSVEEF